MDSVKQRADGLPPRRPDELRVLVHVDGSDVAFDLAHARQAFGLARELGANAIRTDLPWHRLEAQPGQWDTATIQWYREFFATADAFGLAPMPSLVRPPRWARRLYREDPTAFLACWRRYCETVARITAGHVHLVQVWNEPANPFLRLFDRRYPTLTLFNWSHMADIFHVASDVLRGALGPLDIAVNLAADSAGWEQFVSDLLDQSPHACDIIGIDHYPGTWALQPADDWGVLERLMTRVNDPNDTWYGKKPAIIETGYSTYLPWWSTERRQAQWIEQALPRIYAINASWRERGGQTLSILGWYELYDEPGGRLIPPLSRFGILHAPAKKGYTSRKQSFDTLCRYLRPFRDLDHTLTVDTQPTATPFQSIITPSGASKA
ncbi:MAG: glycosyl hydrolase 53 family protein [Anaerolineae bacterium]|nr:glycosyl hydrolase 53 family protein [Anaerolineae bacterium]